MTPSERMTVSDEAMTDSDVGEEPTARRGKKREDEGRRVKWCEGRYHVCIY